MNPIKSIRFFYVPIVLLISVIGICCVSERSDAQERSDINLRTKRVLAIFHEISEIPRCSGNEKHIATWLKSWTKQYGYKSKKDSAGNVLIRIPATTGKEKLPIITLQGHLDMVCEKTSDSNHNFDKDPIPLRYEGDWLSADKTTLGADNGIGIAICLAIAEDKTIEHPAINLLFTTEEEKGFTGAKGLKKTFLKGKTLINIDSEGKSTLTVGCAGGHLTRILLPTKMQKIPKHYQGYQLSIDGLTGGHSGGDIHKNRLNAIKMTGRLLEEINTKTPIHLISIKGGSKVNAIPRHTISILAFDPNEFEHVKKEIFEFKNKQKIERNSKKASIEISRHEPFSMQGLEPQGFNTLMSLIKNLPNGVYRMSPDNNSVVETSNNIGIIKTRGANFTILGFERSSSVQMLDKIAQEIQMTANSYGAKTISLSRFLPWEPDMKSSLLARSKEIYLKTHNQYPDIAVIHGGLECGFIKAKFPDLDMISIGPTIENAHSPDERVEIPSIEHTLKFLIALLRSNG